MKKRVISLIIVIALAVSCLALFSAADIAAETEELGVITAELQAVMRGASATEKIPVSIWTTEIDTDIVEEVVLAKVGINRDMIREMVEAGRIAEITQEQVDEYIAAERRIYAQMQTQAHQTFVEDYAFLKTASTAENAYLCSYAPMICVELTKSQIQTLSLDSEVNTMYYAPKLELVDAMDMSLPTVKADYVRDEAFSGEGIRIGMMESGMPLATAQIPFTNADGDTQVFSDPDAYSRTEHATAVAEIMVSNGDITGIVPDAELYCTSISNVGLFAAAEWLLEQNVHVINMSAANYADSGAYNYIDLWFDHIAHNHSVHFVVAAGNNATYVAHPGLAYNAITVGAIDDNNTSDIFTDDIAANYSCFAECPNSDGLFPTDKPEIVAPGTQIRTSSFPNAVFSNSAEVSGTSFATPHVTGIVAQLIQQYPALATLQDLMKAIITAAVSHPTRQYDSSTAYTTLMNQYGAGVIDAQACTDVSLYGNFASSSFSSTAAINSEKTYTFTSVSSKGDIRISLAWLRSVWFASGSSHETSGTPQTNAALPDLDVIITTPNNETLTYTGNVNNNLLIVQLDPDEYGDGTYTVKVRLKNSTGKKAYFGLAWWQEN